MLWAAALGLAQLDTASIVGTVIDSSGAVIPGAKVQVQNMGTAATVDLTTDGNGNFVAPVLPVGNYKVTVSMSGFGTYVRENIRLNVADRVGLTIELKPGPVTQEVTVVGERPVVETASTTLGGVIGGQQVTNLPLNGRALTQLLSTVAGVSMLGVEPNINGTSTGRLFEAGMKFQVDGIDSGQVDSDLADGGYQTRARMTRASAESIGEVRILTSSFSAEYGQASGAVVNFITKAGTNEFHGSLFEYFRNEKLDARNPFNVLTPKPAFRLNQYGGSLGGPIKKEKTFFFINYEAVRQRLGRAYETLVPTASFRALLTPEQRAPMDNVPLPNMADPTGDPNVGWYSFAGSDKVREDTFAIKIDHNFTSQDRFTARYNVNDSFSVTNIGPGRGQNLVVPYRSQLAKISYTKTLSPTMLNEIGVGVNRMWALDKEASEEDVRQSPMIWFMTGVPANMGPGLFDMRVGNTSQTYLDTLTWIKGRHQMKFGTQIVRNQVNKLTNFQRLLLFYDLANGYPGYGLWSYLSNNPYLIETVGNPTTGQRNTYYNFFVQDDMQATRNLTLNFGLRYQLDTVPSEAHGRNRNFDLIKGELDPAGTQIFKMPKLNFSPRFGFAWNAIPSQQFVIRGGFGIFFTSINPALAQFLPTMDRTTSYYRLVTWFDNPSIQAFPPTDISGGNVAGIFTPIPRDFHTPYNEFWNLNIQKGLGQSTVFQVAYIGNRGLHYATFYDFNRIDPVTHTRPYPAWGGMAGINPGSKTSYNSLQVSVRRRFSRGLTFNVNYTWGHSLDQGEWGFGTLPNDDHNMLAEYGNADYDVRHVLEFDYTYQLPAVPRFPKWLGGGWQLNGITVMRSGTSVNVTCGCDTVGVGSPYVAQRPNVVAGVSPRPADYSIPFNQININAFSAPAQGQFGNGGRNTLKGPAAYNWDFSLFKNFKVREHQTLEFRAEVFNLFNTPQYAAPVANMASLAFGRSTTIINAGSGFFGSNRQIQFALRYMF
jgi:hypothetical protein